MNGLVVVDKPEGPTSFDVVAKLRRVFKTREIGHCGTLDPLATGMLVVTVGTWTRLVRVLTADDKRYTATVSFGTSTTTDDREGDVIERGDASKLRVEDLRAALATFVGTIKQKPPQYSAVHVDGERAYKRARAGEVVEIAEREVVVHAIELVSFSEGSAVLDVKCGKGTYIRSIARDLGKAVGVPAHLSALRRTESGAYTLADAVKLDDVVALQSKPSDVRGVAKLEVTDVEAKALRQGKRVPLGLRGLLGGTALAVCGEDLVALVRSEADVLVVERAFPT